ncbi:hypothetical protein [Bacillus thuringiensis]|uniref:hypothetical protein n=1 Tax=Bacillus thuringiensis TaxID=1428 RepID=UPI000BF64A1C|nr:hypothetical protein [Bacillus thuringiensis]PFU64252.1 hypothetical protein COK95_26910 [Bacillus thuringiensis]
MKGAVLMVDLLKEAIGMLDNDEKNELYDFLKKDLKDNKDLQTTNTIGNSSEHMELKFPILFKLK